MVRQARTVGSTYHQYKVQEVKDVPEDGGRISNSSRRLVSIVMRKAGAETEEIPETIAEIGKENDIGPEVRTLQSNGSEQRVSIVMRKALIQTDEIAENDIGPDGWSGTWDMPLLLAVHFIKINPRSRRMFLKEVEPALMINLL